MLNLLLNIIGIILVLYSILVIRKDMSRKKTDSNISRKSEEIEDEIEKEYYRTREDFTEDFRQIIDSKVEMSNLKKTQSKIDYSIGEGIESMNPIIKEEGTISQDNNISPLHKEIIELKSIGLTNEDIARKLGRGIREIDIVLKLYKM